MAGLSGREREGCEKILNLLSKADILSLSDTVTNKMIVVENVTEAAEAILSFTKNGEELLRRKKVHRDVIFKYLAKEGVKLPPSSEKHQLVRRTLQLWSNGEALAEDRSNHSRQAPLPSTAQEFADVKNDTTFDFLALGQQFCIWFFQLLNSQNPSLGQQPQDWGPQHFWPDVKLRLIARAGSEQMEEFVGAELVSRRLLALTKEELLLLSPNLDSHGLNVLASPHGLVLVAVAGTIHRDAACLGIFEQIFGLIRSPLDNNSWKIRSLNLKIRGQDALGGMQTTAPALSYNTSELHSLCTL
ncbi:uncharacterized protein C3orf38 homolog [Entelurus aequoreus]|uniref:uncharacterized protein C3orf38 homolog n=1 Tax=Entelurus aequoreus TaxID=161455 RepID=UPI002B1E5970|nr:uncharacterized protein C3orf38 homolog [Entelurus aequoreus]